MSVFQFLRPRPSARPPPPLTLELNSVCILPFLKCFSSWCQCVKEPLSVATPTGRLDNPLNPCLKKPAPLNRAAKVNILLVPASVSKKIFPFFLSASPPLLLLPPPPFRLKNPRKAGAKITHHQTIFQIFLRVFLKKNNK